MSEPRSTKPAPRNERAFHDEHPTPAPKLRLILAWLIIGLAAIVMLVLPAVVWLAGRRHWLAWQLDFAALELLGLAAGVVLLSAVYALDPFPHRRRMRKTKPDKRVN